MTLIEYQLEAMKYLRKDIDEDAWHHEALFGMCAELGEIQAEYSKALQSSSVHGGNPITVNPDILMLELGDLLWYMTEYAHVMGTTLEEIAQKNLAKLARRYPDGKFTPEDSARRVDVED